MKKYLLLLAFMGAFGVVNAAAPYTTFQGGTGTSSPSGILYGSNSGSTPLKTVKMGANCTFSVDTLNCTASGLSSYDAWTHPSAGISATTSQITVAGLLSTASSTISSALRLSSLSQGILYTGSTGLVGTAATSSFSLSQFTNDLAALTATNGTLTFSGSYNGATARTVGLNLGNSNTWTVLQTFNYSSTTGQATFADASTTKLTVSNSPSAILLTNSAGLVAQYTGTSCTNQFVRSLSALGSATCATVGAADVSLANLTATDASLTFSGTYNGSTARTIGLNVANANSWSVLQTFVYSSTTGQSTFADASTTKLTVSNSPSSILLTNSVGLVAQYTGTSCTNQFARSLSALGAATCATVGAADVSLANLTSTDASLTFSGTYNGSTARTIGLNLGNANSWTALQTFANATSTLLSSTYSSSTNAFIGTLTLPMLSQGVAYVGSSNIVNTVATSSLSTNGTSIQNSGSMGAMIGGSNATISLNMGNPNIWTALQRFANASSTLLSVFNTAYFGGTATTTIGSDGSITMPSGSTFTKTGVSDGCATWASGVLGTTGLACGSAGGGITALGSGYASTTNTVVTFSTSTLSFNGLTVGQTITASAGALTFTPTITGTLNNSGLTNSTIALSDSNSTLTIGGTPAALGGTLTATFNLAHANSWSALQTFVHSSTTGQATFANASTTVLTVSNSASAVLLTDSGGTVGKYTGATCTNQFVRSLSALAAATCATVGAADVSLANLTATDASLTFSGTYNGSTARTIGLNLANPNTWSVLQTFNYSSSTAYSSFATASSSNLIVTLSALFATTTAWQNSIVNIGGTTTIAGNFSNLRASTSAATTQTIDWSAKQNGTASNFWDIMLTGNTSVVMNSTSSSPIDGGFYKIRFCQDGTGSRTVTWANPVNLRWGSSGTTTISSTANSCTWILFGYVATNGTTIYTGLASTTGAAIK